MCGASVRGSPNDMKTLGSKHAKKIKISRDVFLLKNCDFVTGKGLGLDNKNPKFIYGSIPSFFSIGLNEVTENTAKSNVVFRYVARF